MRRHCCTGSLVLAGTALAVPVRRGRVVVADANGDALFTGYLATEPEAVYSGWAAGAVVYRYALNAVSDEWLLDRLAVPASGAGLGVAGGAGAADADDAGWRRAGVGHGCDGWSGDRGVSAGVGGCLVGECGGAGGGGVWGLPGGEWGVDVWLGGVGDAYAGGWRWGVRCRRRWLRGR